MPAVTIQPCTSVDQLGWLELRMALWPEGQPDTHRREMAAFLAQPERYGQFVAYGADGAAGFAEAAIRTDYVNGTESSPVAFLEGIYVPPPARRQGTARALVAAIEQWALGRGCQELASDAHLDNGRSHLVHLAIGFEETERVVYFRKLLPAATPAPRASRDTLRGITVRDATAGDPEAIAGIYNHYIRDTIVTFEEDPIDAAEMARRMDAVRSASLPWLVAELDGRIVGYAYAGPWKPRVGYRYTAEISVYLQPDAGGRGLGTALYTRLFEILAWRGIRCIIAGIALPNDASVALHEKFGMRKVAHFDRNGLKFGAWIDVGYWQRLLPGRGGDEGRRWTRDDLHERAGSSGSQLRTDHVLRVGRAGYVRGGRSKDMLYKRQVTSLAVTILLVALESSPLAMSHQRGASKEQRLEEAEAIRRGGILEAAAVSGHYIGMVSAEPENNVTSLAQLVAWHGLIVIGRIQSSRAWLTADGGTVVTDYLIAVERVLKGDAAPHITVSIPGGRVTFEDGTTATLTSTMRAPLGTV